MAKLLLKSVGGSVRVIELKLGTNRFGRAPGNDFQIEHPTISSRHCEIELRDFGVMVRDLDSTNGTFVNGEPIKEAKLAEGQTLQLGDVSLFVETTDVTIAIPQFEEPLEQASPPIVLSDGSLLCPNHPKAVVTHQCTYCRLVMCDACFRRLRRRGGKIVKLCPECSHKVEPLAEAKDKKESLLARLRRTMRIPLLSGKSRGPE
jgi:hypothetical protein